jgi:hypothetical protein
MNRTPQYIHLTNLFLKTQIQRHDTELKDLRCLCMYLEDRLASTSDNATGSDNVSGKENENSFNEPNNLP